MAALVSDWPNHFRLLLNRWTEFNETWQEARSQCPLPSVCFFGPIGKQDGHPGLWLADTFLTSFSETAELNSTKLDRKQDLHVFYQVCVFSGCWEKQDARTGVCLAETFSTSSLKLLNGIQWNLTGSKVSMSSTKFVFSSQWVNKNCYPGWSVKKVAHCTQVHDMRPFGPLVKVIFPLALFI